MEQMLDQKAGDKAAAQPEKTRHSSEETPLEAFASICGVLVLGLFALTFIFQNFAIPSSSMEKIAISGQYLL